MARLALDGTFAGPCAALQATDAVSEVGTTFVTAESPDVEPCEATVRDDFLTLEPDRWVTEVLCE